MAKDQESFRLHLWGHCYVREWAVLVALILLMAVVHVALLRVPYYWDEVYFASVARDLFVSGSLIPTSVPVESHPPLVAIWIAGWWKLFGFGIPVARVAMLAVAAFTLVGVHRLVRGFSTGAIAITVTALTAIYPVFFTHSTIVGLDLPAAGLTFWALEAYLRGRYWRSGLLFSLAVLAKETAIIAPIAILMFEYVTSIRARKRSTEMAIPREWQIALPALAPLFVLLCWFLWLHRATGTFMGDPGYVGFSLYHAFYPMRMVHAFSRRLFHAFGYLNLFVLTFSAVLIWVIHPTRPVNSAQECGSRPLHIFAAVIAGYVVVLSIIGTQLPRYLLPVDSLIILASMSLIASRVRWWPVVAGGTAVAFLTALFLYPSYYGLVVEDNLAYLDFVALHQDMAAFLAGAPKGKVLAKYPASSELAEPWLGYVKEPMAVSDVGDVTRQELSTDFPATGSSSQPEYLVMFPTNTVAAHPFPRPNWWRERISAFDDGQLSPAEAAEALNAQEVFFESRRGQWIAVLKVSSAESGQWNRTKRH